MYNQGRGSGFITCAKTRDQLGHMYIPVLLLSSNDGVNKTEFKDRKHPVKLGEKA